MLGRAQLQAQPPFSRAVAALGGQACSLASLTPVCAPCSLSLSHPNVLQSYKCCAVRVLTDAESEAATSGPPGGLGGLEEASHSAGQGSSGSGGSGNVSGTVSGTAAQLKLIASLTNPNCLVQVMPPDAVLEPGIYEMWLVSAGVRCGRLYGPGVGWMDGCVGSA